MGRPRRPGRPKAGAARAAATASLALLICASTMFVAPAASAAPGRSALEPGNPGGDAGPPAMAAVRIPAGSTAGLTCKSAGDGGRPESADPAPLGPGQTDVAEAVELRGSTWYRSSADAIWVQGEVVNGLHQAVGRARVIATFRAGPVTVATVEGFAAVANLPAGSSVVYSLFLADAPPGIDRVTVEVSGYDEPPGLPPVGLRVVGLRSSASGYGHLRDVVGSIRNESSSTYTNVWVHVGFYDAAGNVVRAGVARVDPLAFTPGQSATFAVNGDVAGSDTIACRAWVDAG